MHFQCGDPAEAFAVVPPQSIAPSRPFKISWLPASLVFTLLIGFPGRLFSGDQVVPVPVQRTGKATSSQVGSAMAVLATLEQAQVLPPEGTREANQIIKSVIQFQSAFARSTNHSVRDFVDRAVTVRHGDAAAALLGRFRSVGWTPEVLVALADAELHSPAGELESLAVGLQQFNLTVEDFRRLMRLVREGQQAFTSQGRTFHDVYGSHRKTMPGAALQ